jgi:hypothetical protein
MSKRHLLVTLADDSFIEQAKQVFASAYLNSGWDGDYMLLAHNVSPENIEWFESKHILVKRCEPLYDRDVGGMSPSLTSKFYLFQPEFKQWEVIIYVDADTTINASLNRLKRVKGFAAVKDAGWKTIREQVHILGPSRDEDISLKDCMRLCDDLRLNKEIERRYGMRRRSFCAGVFAFNTRIIDGQLFAKLKSLSDRYEGITRFGDQLAFNLCFYRRWRRLPAVYNVYADGGNNQWALPVEKTHGIIDHYTTFRKPWIAHDHYYLAWKKNYDLRRSFQAEVPSQKCREWSRVRVCLRSAYFDLCFLKLAALRNWFVVIGPWKGRMCRLSHRRRQISKRIRCRWRRYRFLWGCWTTSSKWGRRLALLGVGLLTAAKTIERALRLLQPRRGDGEASTGPEV